MNKAFLALGSNIGDRERYVKDAILSLNEHPAIKVEKISSIYETDPVGYVDQDAFLNMVLSVRTDLSAFQLLDVMQGIEKELGRKRELKWGPRTLDLDILLFNHENIETEHLIIPHPRMLERSFVLIPLYEIQPEIKIPNSEQPLSIIIDQLTDKKGVRIWKQKNGEDVFALFES
ncbi:MULTISPECIES: 2-amino-4-hydroxy-6-hydroxymethyldihydropteridine diphosphokinase [Metabacillus]|uniref:2-amino-4-hydroxy-6-hydroxymethyldihydropteridine diphosphokinase n=1 Tax=Metabacillus hrfriensis TaxID=3048891 RepID=A0ACD4RBV9_9BACI|nr:MULTISPECIES: 2-amino-4-hydroxy-6-hydroxymethyldihydropteridine diphosphokinase [Metabacillus]UAL52406.1 2-amino-4-hydroxy-6-hydroxymethyldihydropteridine diphosphokinase [Metabacillus dongyingensis]UOK58127.1 2-amino-4-hydroxy-6-hydroxymethyldihydropteridine diphosphokinase [Bacillus sp. OVS6]USK28716.1 2-amino-4-hydroxy-6-hydroxymethyldihydropteridine diphosphokinase [Bacillus sp. CMF21]WHZ57934.1 2-amino-4-hydroxy-6-hydroxymethyldihydropteridine diphosphokinase [Metabacillus sp. CT-WN-B3]